MNAAIYNVPVWVILFLLICMISIIASSNGAEVRREILCGVFGYFILVKIGPGLLIESLGNEEEWINISLKSIPFFTNLFEIYGGSTVLTLLKIDFIKFCFEILQLFLLMVILKFGLYFVPKISADKWWVLLGTLLLNYLAIALLGTGYLLVNRYILSVLPDTIIKIVSVSLLIVMIAVILIPVVGVIAVAAKLTKNPIVEKIVNIINQIKMGNGLQGTLYAIVILVLGVIVLQQLGVFKSIL